MIKLRKWLRWCFLELVKSVLLRNRGVHFGIFEANEIKGVKFEFFYGRILR